MSERQRGLSEGPRNVGASGLLVVGHQLAIARDFEESELSTLNNRPWKEYQEKVKTNDKTHKGFWIMLKTQQNQNATRTRQNVTFFEGHSTDIFGCLNFTSHLLIH